jgi:hypothetical protein
MRQVSAKFVPRLLTEEQKDNCVNVCCDLKEELRNDPNFLTKIVTGYEYWCYAYDPLCSLWSPITIIAGCCE